jgi:flavin reductase (DIM6/NTAB) family NADH-FMN oxidoreductase RutF
MKKVIPASPWLFPLPPILVTCQEPGKKPNIITLAWCGVVASNPVLVQIGVRPSRYSHDLILRSREFVINIPTRKLVWAVDFCGNITGKKTNKFKETGLTPADPVKVKVPVIKQCPINLECRVVGTIKLGTHTHFLGEVLAVQVDEKILDENGKLNVKKLDPLAFFPIAEQYYSIGKLLGNYGFTRKK